MVRLLSAHVSLMVWSFPLTVCSWSAHGPFMICSRSAHGQIMVSTRSIHDLLTVSSWSDHGQHTVHSCSAHGQLMVRSWSVHGPFMICSRSVYGPLTIRLRYAHGLLLVRSLSLTVKQNILPLHLNTSLGNRTVPCLWSLVWTLLLKHGEEDMTGSRLNHDRPYSCKWGFRVRYLLHQNLPTEVDSSDWLWPWQC